MTDFHISLFKPIPEKYFKKLHFSATNCTSFSQPLKVVKYKRVQNVLPAREASREVADFIEGKNTHPPVYCVKDLSVCRSVYLSVTSYDLNCHTIFYSFVKNSPQNSSSSYECSDLIGQIWLRSFLT